MTKEIEIPYLDADFDVNLINQYPIHLTQDETLDDQSDLTTSIKFVDSKGKSVLLIETTPRNICSDEINKNIQGCYVIRFEFVKKLLEDNYNGILSSFLSHFVSLVKCLTKAQSNGNYLTHYNYIWADKEHGDNCVIAKLLGISLDNTFSNLLGLDIYKGKL